MVKKYRQKANRNYYLKNSIILKIKNAINEHIDKKYIIIKKVISKIDAQNCIDKRVKKNYVQIQDNRYFDSYGSKKFTNYMRKLRIRYHSKETNSDNLDNIPRFKDFYKIVAECLGMKDAVVNEHDRMIVHEVGLTEMQPWHIDANKDNVTTRNGETVSGLGDGFSAFIGLSAENSIWVADFNTTDNSIREAERVQFSAGDCVILKYGTVHKGDDNTKLPHYPKYKTFTDVNSGKTPDNKSQLWVIEGDGGGYSRTKPP